jgi:hypothetical protein
LAAATKKDEEEYKAQMTIMIGIAKNCYYKLLHFVGMTSLLVFELEDSSCPLKHKLYYK